MKKLSPTWWKFNFWTKYCTTLTYVDFTNLKSIHNRIRDMDDVKWVNSIINERKIINSSLIPITSKV